MNVQGTFTRAIHTDFWTGMRDTLPSVPGLAPFAMIVGITMVETGFSDVQTIVMSAVMFSGAAQLAAGDLIVIGSHPVVVVLAALVVNSRFMIFSASIAPYFSKYSTKEKWFMAFFLGDLHYAIAINKYRNGSVSIYWYYLGTAVTVYLTWVFGTAAGVLVGARLPDELNLEFTIALVFLALLVSLVDDLLDLGVAFVAGLVSILVADFPYDSGLLVAPVVGVTVGLLVRRVLNE